MVVKIRENFLLSQSSFSLRYFYGMQHYSNNEIKDVDVTVLYGVVCT